MVVLARSRGYDARGFVDCRLAIGCHSLARVPATRLSGIGAHAVGTVSTALARKELASSVPLLSRPGTGDDGAVASTPTSRIALTRSLVDWRREERLGERLAGPPNCDPRPWLSPMAGGGKERAEGGRQSGSIIAAAIAAASEGTHRRVSGASRDRWCLTALSRSLELELALSQ